jgi:urocanate hydratase
MCLVLDGTEEIEARARLVLTTDPGIGVVRHADAGYDVAKNLAKQKGIKMPMLDSAATHINHKST